MEQNWYSAVRFADMGITPVESNTYTKAQWDKYWFVYNYLVELMDHSECGYKFAEYGVYNNHGSIEEYVRVCNNLEDKYDGRYINVSRDSKIALARDVINNLW